MNITVTKNLRETAACRYVVDAAIRFKVNDDVIAAESGVSDAMDRLHAPSQTVVQENASRNEIPTA